MQPKYQSKPYLNKVVKTPDLLLIIEAIGLDENSTWFEQELKFGVLANEEQYQKIPDQLKKHFKPIKEVKK